MISKKIGFGMKVPYEKLYLSTFQHYFQRVEGEDNWETNYLNQSNRSKKLTEESEEKPYSCEGQSQLQTLNKVLNDFFTHTLAHGVQRKVRETAKKLMRVARLKYTDKLQHWTWAELGEENRNGVLCINQAMTPEDLSGRELTRCVIANLAVNQK